MTTTAPAPIAGLLPEAGRFVSRAAVPASAADHDGPWIPTVDPSTGREITTVAACTDDEVDVAVRAAHEAFTGSWGRMSPFARERALHRLADLIEEHALELAQYDALESGKPVAFVEAVDIGLAVEQFRYYAGWPSKIAGSVVAVPDPSAHVYTTRRPYGVVAAITPWNFPFCQAAIKIAPALAAGNTVVLKPSELTSLSTLRLAELALEAGLPEGTVSVVTGPGSGAGAALVAHPLVPAISFTGSEAVGRRLAAQAGADLKHISLELGGKNPNVVFADADVEQAAAAAATTAFFYTGQVCFAGSRLMVEESVLDDVLAVVHDHAASLVVGPGLSPSSTMGPLVSAAHRDKVRGFVDGVAGTGARVTTGGRDIGGELADGYFFEPTVVVDPADASPVASEEVFGPVLVVQTFRDEEELVRRANGTRYGLTAGLWTRDVGRAHRLADRLHAGTVWVNTYGDFSATAPWGGAKASGLGRDCGPDGLAKHLETKTVWLAG
ncbi:aldehyde dehydrogenase family protein [Geodermatophilus sp. SYSU D00705]